MSEDQKVVRPPEFERIVEKLESENRTKALKKALDSEIQARRSLEEISFHYFEQADDLENRLNEAESALAHAQSELASLKKESRVTEKKLDEFEVQIAKSQKLAENLQTDLHAANSSIAKARQETDLQHRTVSDAQKTSDALRKELATVKSEKLDLQSAAATAKEDLATAEAVIKRKDRDINVYRAGLIASYAVCFLYLYLALHA